MQMHNMTDASNHAGAKMANVAQPDDLVELLNDLFVTNRGMVKVYETAVERIENKASVELLQQYAAKHEKMLTELSNLIVKYGGVPATGFDTGNLLKRVWITLKAAATDGDGPILVEVAQDSKTVLAAYGDLLGHPSLPVDVRDLIREQMSEVRIIYKKLSALSAAFA